jgi:membrane protein implicated in regulation of membrane protease activity
MIVLWWHWLLLGLVLVIGEIAGSGGFFIIFFGLAAVLVGILSSAGLGGPLWMQLLLFSVLSVATTLLFRTRLLKTFQYDPQAPAVDQLVGEVGTATADLPPGEVGRVELRGAMWSARNASDATLPSGTRCRVTRVDGLLLYVGPEGAA